MIEYFEDAARLNDQINDWLKEKGHVDNGLLADMGLIIDSGQYVIDIGVEFGRANPSKELQELIKAEIKILTEGQVNPIFVRRFASGGIPKRGYPTFNEMKL